MFWRIDFFKEAYQVIIISLNIWFSSVYGPNSSHSKFQNLYICFVLSSRHYSLFLCCPNTLSQLKDCIIALRLRSVRSLEDSWLYFHPFIVTSCYLTLTLGRWHCCFLWAQQTQSVCVHHLVAHQQLRTTLDPRKLALCDSWVRELLDISSRVRVGLILLHGVFQSSVLLGLQLSKQLFFNS